MPLPVQAMLAEKKSGSGGFPVRRNSPASFSAVKPPENRPAENLYLVSNFHGGPGADVSEAGNRCEKLESKTLPGRDETDPEPGSELRERNGETMRARSGSKPGMDAIS